MDVPYHGWIHCGGIMNKIAMILFFTVVSTLHLFSVELSYFDLDDSFIEKTMVDSDEKWSLSLNGEWAFSPIFDQSMLSSAYPIDDLKLISVPSQWEQSGFSIPLEQTALYLRDLSISKHWRDRQVKIHFDSVYSLATVYINGVQVGSHEGGFVPFELDLTAFAVAGETMRIAVAVTSASTADTLGSGNQYAAHSLGGINRKVSIFSVPTQAIRQLQVNIKEIKSHSGNPLLVSAEIRGELEISLKSELPQSISIQLTPLKKGFNSFAQMIDLKGLHIIPTDVNADKGIVRFIKMIELDNPALWNAEVPHLNRMEASLIDSNGVVIHHIKKRVALRHIAVKNRRLFINGTPVLLSGVNRHEAHPLTGRVLTPLQAKLDAQLFKEANCNYIRTSHYPPMPEFLDACDEVGLYVELESPLCWVGHGANTFWAKTDHRGDQWFPLPLSLNRETSFHYANSGCVVMRSLANESMWSDNWDKVHRKMKAEFPSDIYVFHDQAWGSYNNKGSDTEIANYHYSGPGGVDIASNLLSRPVLFGEYTHLNVYNRREVLTDPSVREGWGVALARMWETIEKADCMVGAAVWSGIDDLFYLPDGKAVGYGPWGVIDGWRRKKPEFWMMKKSYSPVKLALLETESSQPFIRIENRFDFLNLNKLKFVWKQKGLEGVWPVEGVAGDTIDLLNSFPFDLNDDWNLAVFQQNRLIDQYYFSGQSKINQVVVSESEDESLLTPLKAILSRNNSLLTVKGALIEWTFDLKQGIFISFSKDGVESKMSGPDLMLIPLTSEECFPEYRQDIQPLNELCQQTGFVRVKWSQEEGDILIKVKKKYKEATGHFIIRLNNRGELTSEYRFRLKKPISPRQYGLVYSFDSSFNQIDWERKGFFSYYPDDHIGRCMGTAYSDVDSDDFKLESLPLAFKPSGDFQRWIPHSLSWSLDENGLGSADFRSTRTNIIRYSLKNKTKSISLVSDGSQHCRSWREGDWTRMLSADFNSPGFEIFLQSHLTETRKPLGRWAVIKAIQHLQFN